ncbi:MAG: hypothetical protein JWM90_1382 [Thermoleophilia bacterium]|nr:hypothetical protein [Thermoleophilia bacterium]
MGIHTVLHVVNAALLLGGLASLVKISRGQTHEGRRFLAIVGLCLFTTGSHMIVGGVLALRGPTLLVVDCANLIAVLLLVWSLQSGLRAMRSNSLRMEQACAEYGRAQGDYDQLMSHRICNPLTVIDAGVQLLMTLPDLSPAAREQLLVNMEGATRALRAVSMELHAIRPEERGFDGEVRAAMVAAG